MLVTNSSKIYILYIGYIYFFSHLSVESATTLDHQHYYTSSPIREMFSVEI